jgi:Putative polyhydroxyalkanoic acid system protein (PHA_gran_rgn)
MSKPLVVSIPHRLGKEEAVRRLKTGLGQVRSNFGGVMQITEEIWSGERLAFRVAVLGQAANGTMDVADDHVRVEVQLPWLLGKLAAGARAMIEKQGHLMLEKK